MKGLELDPDHQEIRYTLGLAQCKAGKFRDASFILEGIVEEDPKQVAALTLLGTAYYAMGDLPKAKVSLEKAIALNPKAKESYFNLAQVMIDSDPQDLEMAMALYKKAVELGAKRNKEIEAILKPKPETTE